MDEMNELNGAGRKSRSLGESFRHAADGFKETFLSERNMKLHCAATVIVAACAVVLGLSAAEKAVLLILCALVIAAELFNTALENAVDICAPAFNMYARRAKDAAAAAVLTLSIAAAIVGIIIFFPYGLNIIYQIQKLI